MRCSKCNNNLDSILSTTNSTYYYCNNCKNEKEKALKNIAFDSLLKNLRDSLKFSNNNYYKVELSKQESTFNLLINSIFIKSIPFNYTLNKTDIYFLENTVSYLIEDNCNINISKVDVLIAA